MDRITKRRLREALGFTQDSELAEFFDISQSAVSQWDEDRPIPKLRQLEAERLRPECFRGNAANEAAR